MVKRGARVMGRTGLVCVCVCVLGMRSSEPESFGRWGNLINSRNIETARMNDPRGFLGMLSLNKSLGNCHLLGFLVLLR